MRYFGIEYSLNEDIVGEIPQIKEVIHSCHIEDEPHFIDKFPFEKIEINPILSNVVLNTKSNRTDAIKINSIGFSFGSLVISDRFKKILEQFNCYCVQFFPTYILHENEECMSYWQTHIYKIPYEYIDFKNTDILIKERDTNGKSIQKYLNRTSKEEFLQMTKFIKYPKMIYLKNISFSNQMNLDFFYLRYTEGNNYGIVSERLKIELEKQGITGIEFKPFELTLQEWYSSGLREKYYGKT